MFLVSSVFAGLSMIIFEGSISERVFSNQISQKNREARKDILQVLSRICAFTIEETKGIATEEVAPRVSLGEARHWVLDPNKRFSVKGFVNKTGEQGIYREFVVVDADESLAGRKLGVLLDKCPPTKLLRFLIVKNSCFK